MFIVLGDICFSCLPEGDIRKKRVTAETARDLVCESGAGLTGCFDFGAVPSERRDRDFRDLISVLRDQHGIDIDPEIFFSPPVDPDPDEETPLIGRFPIPPQLARLSPSRPLLVVSYAFAMQRDRGSDGSRDPLSWLRICPDSITFHLLETIASLE